VKPNFLVVGAPRSGTTTLYEGLAQHPEIYMSPRKEPWFSELTGQYGPWLGPRDGQPVATWTEYEQLFAGANGQKAIGEASTLYLGAPEAPRRIKESLPDARLICILRNPVDRAYSNFLEHVQEGRETELDFRKAVEAESSRLGQKWAPSWAYTGLGHYGEQLGRYFAELPREQMLVLLYEDLKEDRVGVYTRIFTHLGVHPGIIPVLPPRINENSGIPKNHLVHVLLTHPNPVRQALRSVLTDRQRKSVRSWLLHHTLQRPHLDPDLRLELIERFRDDILRTADLIGRDLSGWLAPSEAGRQGKPGTA
jgi:hypothetical protein